MAEYRFHVTPLTPIHIGSGDILEPFEYVISEKRLYRFSMDRFLLALPRQEQPRFVEVVGRSIPATRTFVAERAATAQQVARWQANISGPAIELYHQRMGGAEGHPEIRSAGRTGDRLYLPASSLKGALRTALLYHHMDPPQEARDARNLEQSVFQFRRVQEDPFRAFKLGDGPPLEPPATIRAVAVNTQRYGRWEEDVPLLVETMAGLLSDHVEQTSVHAVRFDDDFYRLHPRAFRLTPQQIIEACRTFYGLHLESEREALANLPAAAAAYQALAEHAEAMPAYAGLVRLGWGSGRDATTVSYGLAHGKRPSSRRLTEDGFPLGWAELSIVQPDNQPLSMTAAPAVATPPPQKPTPKPKTGPRRIDDLTIGIRLEGQVRRTEQYGAFVDIGVGRDGLIHVSKLADHYVNRVEDIVKRGDRVRVEVITIDPERNRIGLKLLSVEK